MKNKLVIKNRERFMRGKLNSFSDLPLEKQTIFKNIKQSINKYLDVDVYVFGSYNHGYWDEESDYDVIIFSENCVDIMQDVRNETGVKLDIMFGKNNIGYIAIP
jgi:predicted nucleotidyltransferase